MLSNWRLERGIIAAAILVLLYLLYKNSRPCSSSGYGEMQRAEVLRSCILATKTDAWKKLPATVNNCVSQLTCIRRYPNITTRRYKIYPMCKMYGIEPSVDKTANFSAIGTVIPVAAGVADGIQVVRRMTGEGNNFVNENMSVHALDKVVKIHLAATLVHFAAIDIEGAEFDILNALRHGQPLSKLEFCQNYVPGVLTGRIHDFICQKTKKTKIDAELHPVRNRRFTHGERYTDFEHFWSNFLLETPYIPFYAFDHNAIRRVTLINTKNRECLRLFDVQKYLTCEETT